MADLLLDDLTLLPVIPNPGKVFCVGLNYFEHVSETGRQSTTDPTVVLRVADSQTAHDHDLIVPKESVKLDYEGEVAIVIGKPGRRIQESLAWNHIARYSCYNDGSVEVEVDAIGTLRNRVTSERQ